MNTAVETGVRCAHCGRALEELPSTAEESRIPCPGCGAMSRVVQAQLTEAVNAQDYMNLTQLRDDQVIGFAETERDDRASRASIAPSGSVEAIVSGRPSQGEEDTGAVCELLRAWLNQNGDEWTAVEGGEEPADRLLVHGRDSGKRLPVQVVRALVGETLYRELGERGEARRELAPIDAAGELRRAIDHKAKALPTGRAALALALDATRVPGLAFDAVVREFRAKHAREVSAYGFLGIWLVGPQSRLTWRLDMPLK